MAIEIAMDIGIDFVKFGELKTSSLSKLFWNNFILSL